MCFVGFKAALETLLQKSTCAAAQQTSCPSAPHSALSVVKPLLQASSRGIKTQILHLLQ